MGISKEDRKAGEFVCGNKVSEVTFKLQQNDPETGEPSEDLEYIVEDTPLLVNIKGCGYPPTITCDLYAEKYDNYSKVGLCQILFN